MQLDPRSWRPQAFGNRKPKDLRDPIVEPAWTGVRVLAHVAGGRASLVDVEGEDLGGNHPAIVGELVAGVLAETLVVDGYLTDQALRSGVGVVLDVDDSPSLGAQVTQFFFGSRAADYVGDRTRPSGRAPAGAVVRPTPDAEPGAPTSAFFAVDLLVLDDEPLLDVPLLERKRLLESVVPEGDRVRVTPFVREPAGTFITTWRSAGFVGLAYKCANSRYVPGGRNDDWSLIDMPRR
jgi:ATP-dependent DNA ligase